MDKSSELSELGESAKLLPEVMANDEIRLPEPPRPQVVLMRRGPKTYATCPTCKSAWSLRERLYDLRSGKPCDLNLLSCPTCKFPVSLPRGTDITMIK